MRLRLVCTMAVILPTAIDSTASTVSICCQSTAIDHMPSTSKRMQMAKVASLGAPAISRVTEVGAPW